MSTSRLHELSEHGQSVWIDYLSRDLLRSGTLQQMIEQDSVVGVTSNPTIFERALADTDAYDEQLAELAEEESSKEQFLELAVRDVTEACELLLPIWERTAGRDGWVSIEVDPHLAYDARATIEEAERLHRQISRPNLFVKIAATEPGLVAIEEMIARGRSINVTLIFSLQRYAGVVESYLRGLERLVDGGGDPASVWSVASFFVSRVDTETDKRLDALGSRGDLKGRLAIANAKLAYHHYQQVFSGQHWESLKARGAHEQRCLWASTSVKNPAYRDTLYVEELLGADTIATMPEETIRAFQDHGRVTARLEQNVGTAGLLLEQLADAGIEYDDVVDTLEREGIAKFIVSFDKLLRRLETRTAHHSVGVRT